MKAYKVEKIVKQDGVLLLNGLPFHSGEIVEIIILRNENNTKKHKLRNMVLKYDKPFEPIAQRICVFGVSGRTQIPKLKRKEV